MKMLFVLAVCASSAFAQPSSQLLNAIRQVESGNRNNVVGDNGRAIGPYQIHRRYWLDACAYDRTLSERSYEACYDPEYARRVVVAYLSRYGKGKNDEQLARIHNGGPSGHRKSATKSYWVKIKKEMK